jgi:hypothetical protein
MANEFIARKGLIALDDSQITGSLDVSGSLTINTSGSTVFEIIGSEGQLFAVTDNLSGSLFAVSDVSGLPILEVFSDDTVKIGSFNAEAITVSGSNTTLGGVLSIPGFANVSSSLAAAVAGGDNLGNHTATQNLDMGGFQITNVGNVDGIDVSTLTAANISGAFDSVSASLAADIPTNNNQLTNGAGYTTNTGTVTVYGTSPTNGQVTVWRSATSAQAISGFEHDGTSFKPTNVTFESGDTGTVYPSSLQADGGVGDIIKVGSTIGMTTGDLYYWNGTSWATATSANAATSSLLGIAAGASSATNGHIIRGIVQTGDTLTAGAPVYLIGTGGRVGSTAPTSSGQSVRIAGYAISNQEFYFNPSPDWFTIS